MRAASIVIAISAVLAAPSAHALGFGRVSNATQLGQALNFAATVHVEADETLPRECVTADVFSGDTKLLPSQLRVTLEAGPNAAEHLVRVTSSTLIDEPVLTVSVTLGCTAKVTRKFVAFIDPPVTNLAQVAPAIDASMHPPQRVDSPVAPLLSLVQSGAPVPPTDRSSGASEARAKRHVNAAERSGAHSAARTTTAATKKVAARKEPAARKTAIAARAPARAASAGPRLQLETTPVVVARAASGAVDASGHASPGAAASSAGADEQALLLERERQRIVFLEEGLARIRSESQATQATLAALQTRLKESEAARYANPLVYALAWLSGLLLLAVAALLWRQSRPGKSPTWWAVSELAATPSKDRAGAESAASPDPAAAPLGDHSTLANAFGLEAGTDSERSGPVLLSVPHVAAPMAPVVVPVEQGRELSVEELIDLEQQAEFFVVLGQDEAAIELLMSHVRSDGGISPLPYLKLLEIYRRRGDRDAYERVRERFNRRFNAYAPGWDADLQQGRSLEDYPEIIDRLRALWPTPARAMETLDASLFRRNASDETFDLPAYRELLFLYSIARDLAEHGGSVPRGDVDLLLPLADDDPVANPVSRLLATRGRIEDSAINDPVTLPLDLDVSLDVTDDASLDTSPSALRRVAGPRFATESGFLDLEGESAVALGPRDKGRALSGR